MPPNNPPNPLNDPNYISGFVPDFLTKSVFEPPNIRVPAIMPAHQLNPAKWTYERLAEYIKDFEAKLDSEHEIGARLVSFGQTLTFHIQDLGYYGPDIITFDGITETGERVQLIQNISQLSVLLMAVTKREEKAKRIGFDLTRKVAEDEAELTDDD